MALINRIVLLMVFLPFEGVMMYLKKCFLIIALDAFGFQAEQMSFKFE